MAAKKKFDPKAKEKRQKMIVVVGGVLLLGLLAFQVPKTMKLLNRKPVEPAAVPVSTTPGNVPLAPPSVSAGGTPTGTPAPAGSTGNGGFADSDPSPSPKSGQLVSFGRFVSKDPFKQQMDPTGSEVSVEGDGKKQGGDGKATTPDLLGGSPGSSSPGQAPLPLTATLAVNGTVETLAADKDFPTADPIFHLVKIGRDHVKISIAGGTFANGEATMTIKKGQTITLMNTADGTRYEIKLVGLK